MKIVQVFLEKLECQQSFAVQPGDTEAAPCHQVHSHSVELNRTTSSRLACLVDLIHIRKQGRPWELGVFTVFEAHFKNLVPTTLKLNNLAGSL